MHRKPRPSAASGRIYAAVLCLAALLTGCGGGDFAEQFVKLITARFVPTQVSPPRGSPVQVEFEITCDRAGLDTPFGRLGVEVKFDPEANLPAGITVAPQGGSEPDAEGFRVYSCNSTGASADLRTAHVMLQIVVGAEVPAGSYTLVGFVQVEPLDAGGPSKDSTTANLTIVVSAGNTPTPPGEGRDSSRGE